MSPQKGFTVVESLVALTLIGVGVAAWMATATVAVAVASDAERAASAAYRARTRAEQLAAVPCDAVVAGADAPDSWTVRVFPGGMRLVETQSPYRTRAQTRVARYAMLVEC